MDKLAIQLEENQDPSAINSVNKLTNAIEELTSPLQDTEC